MTRTQMANAKFDLSNRGLVQLDRNSLKETLGENTQEQITDLSADSNLLIKLEGVETFINLIQLSLANNRLVEVRPISKLIKLERLDLSKNSLASLDCLKTLNNLTWLNVAGNQIKSLEPLRSNRALQRIDASNNSIDHICDLSSLAQLQTLNLNGNEITTLENIHNLVPMSITNLFLSFNVIEDLNEVQYLEPLVNLNSFSIKNNPCVAFSATEAIFNYRPFLLIWCPSLHCLDDIPFNYNEVLKAEWLLRHGKARNFVPGQQAQLVEYLFKITPFLASQIGGESVDKTNPASNVQPQEEKFIDRAKFSSEENIPETGQKLESKGSSDMEISKSSYVNYDNRPIKPLDTNVLYKQLAEYAEISNDELEQMKEKFIKAPQVKQQQKHQHVSSVRARVTRRAANSAQQQNASSNRRQDSSESPNSMPLVGRKITAKSDKTNRVQESRLAKQRTFSSNQAISKPQTSNNSPGKTNSIKKQFSDSGLTPKRTKLTKHELLPSPLTKPNASSTKKSINPIQTCSPVKKSALPQKRRLLAGKTEPENQVRASRTRSSSPQSENPDESKLSTVVPSQAHISTEKSLKRQLESIQNKRNELRLGRAKSLREIKNEAKMLDQQKEMSLFESIFSKTVSIPKNLTFEDRCAIKIQAAWRGFYCRNNKFIRPIVLYLRHEKMVKQLRCLQQNLRELKSDQKKMNKFVNDSVGLIKTQIKAFGKTQETSSSEGEFNLEHRIKPLSMEFNQNQRLAELENENCTLKNKCKQLEGKCRELESKIGRLESLNNSFTNLSITGNYLYDKTNVIRNTARGGTENEPSGGSTAPQQARPQIHPPLRVRLQKLNEKSVALKWNHNSKNALIELTGYNIYINDDLLATMRPSDKIASVDGMKDEGEYRIYIRAVVDQIESEPSNVVITRVKKKQNENPSASGKQRTSKTLNNSGFEEGKASYSSNSPSKASPTKSEVQKNRQTVATAASRVFNTDVSTSELKDLNNRTNSLEDVLKSPQKKIAPHAFAEIAESLKFSTSEPNLTKTHSVKSGSAENSLLRQSMSFSDSQN